MKPKIIFFGTHDFGAGILKHLIDSGDFEIILVVCQPDRPSGRKMEITKCAVKSLADENGLPTFQPESLKNSDISELNTKLSAADLNIVCQYGLIIPKTIIDGPKFGSINVHTSLLPKYRGASPVQSALMNGETETGVTIMKMDELMDHGPLLSSEKITIQKSDTYPELRQKMLPVAQKLLLSTIKNYLLGNLKPKTQNEDEATCTKILKREDGKVDWKMPAEKIYDLWRGLTPWPGLWTTWEGKRIKLLKIEPVEVKADPGAVIFKDHNLLIGTGNGSIKVNELQLEGKKSTDAKSFVSGQKQFIGTVLS